METNLLNINQIASLLKISKKRVESLLESDAFPFNRYHRRVIVKAENLIQYLAGRLAKVDSILPSHKEMGDKA